MPRIFRPNDFIISEEVFSIRDEDLEEPEQEEAEPLLDGEFLDELYGAAEDGSGSPDTRRAPALPPFRKREIEQRQRQQDEQQASEIVQRAREEAALIINQANLQAKLDHDQHMRDAQVEIEQLRQQNFQQAREVGRAEGAQEAIAEVRACITAIEQAVSRMEGDQAGFMVEYEHDLKWLSLEIASKVLGKKLAEDETEMVGLVRTAVSSVKNAEWITVEISEKMPLLIDKLSQMLRKSEDQVDIRSIAAPEGTCIIDTPSGRVDASVYKQLENLRIYFSQEEE